MTMAKAEPAEKPAAKPAAAPAPKPAEPAPAAAPAVKSEPAPAPAAAPAATHHKKLPKTGTPLPLLELAGALSMLAGFGVRGVRKSSR
jgi:LPXTG-motif cell wall-anchored protein